MITPKSVFQVVIPEWQNKLKVGTVIAQYYGPKDIVPKKHNGATLKKFGKKSLFIDCNGKKIIKNKASLGNPIFWTMNGQGFYNNTIHWSVRSRVVKYYHKYFTKYIKEQLIDVIPTFLSYKLTMEIMIYDVYGPATPDISNMWILPKMFEDAVVNAKVLRDDSPEFRRRTEYDYMFVEDEKDRKLVVTFKYKKY
jgi:hypothetical protein